MFFFATAGIALQTVWFTATMFGTTSHREEARSPSGHRDS